jgi:hypothetical protein
MKDEIARIKNTVKVALPLGTMFQFTYVKMAMNSTRAVHQTRNAFR